MTLNPQQQALVSWALKGKGSANLIARAGCGKTFTLMELVKVIPGCSFMGAYNKAIATELDSRLRKLGIDWKKAKAATLHSAGYNAWRKIHPNVQIDGNKLDLILARLADEARQSEEYRQAEVYDGATRFIKKAVSLAKQRALGYLHPINDREQWFDLIEWFDLMDDLQEDYQIEECIGACVKVLQTSLAMDTEVIDFDDMILAPLVHKARFWQYDWVLLDEAQDTNPARRALALKLLRPGGRFVAVGDPAQAIYGFTGADSDSMDQIRNRLGSTELPLNLTYRCPKAVVREAQRWVPDIQAHPDNPEGVVRRLQNYDPRAESHFETEPLLKSDAILCRNTKPLVEMAYSLLRRGVACHVEGKEIGQGLISLAQKWKIKSLSGLRTRLEDYEATEISKFLAKGKEAKAAAVEDKVETLLCLIDGLIAKGQKQVTDLVAFIQSLFGDSDEVSQDNVTLCTVHKSKGREWDRVFILGMNRYMPSPYAKSDWAQQQERNLQYVAVTRAKAELIYIEV
jgi:superfamily I DNA/RNA helicase